MRVKKGAASRRAKKRILKAASGYWGGRHKLIRTAKETLIRARAYAFAGRKERKRDFRALWITRINAAVRALGMTYNRFIEGLTKAKVAIDRKMLAELAVSDAKAFEELVALAKKQLQPA
jgi:large subunit ribosomal protein L20